jgi:hypothetical protein
MMNEWMNEWIDKLNKRRSLGWVGLGLDRVRLVLS